jgi:hypothetical protein
MAEMMMLQCQQFMEDEHRYNSAEIRGEKRS